MSRLSEGLRPSRGTPRTPEFSPNERRLLLQIAHQSIVLAAENRELPATAYSAHLSEHRGVFTTLYQQGALRGCVGYAMPVAPLYRAVAESARAAAFEDSRFWPVSAEEALQLEISLSVLSRLFPVRPEEIQVGEHGIVVSLGTQRGLLLPQVPAEYGWDRDTFLAQACRKAGLDARAWQHGATLEAFTAEVFGDKDL